MCTLISSPYLSLSLLYMSNTMTITKVKYIEVQGYPHLVVQHAEYGKMTLGYEQRFFNWGEYLFVGSEFNSVVPELEANVNGHKEKLQGFIQDDDLSKIYLEWKEACDTGDYELGIKPWPTN